MSQEFNRPDPARRRSQRLEQVCVVIFSLVVSLPFCNKAFHIDDPLYLSIARQILVDPLRPYDGLINWQQVTEPAWRVSISPPGYSYWLAAWIGIGVTGEWWLHVAAAFWLVVLGLATHAWASRLGTWPLAATFIVLSNPIALAGQNLMLDIPMLALAAAAIAVYLRATDKNSAQVALLAGVLAGLSVNVKYAGVVAIGVMALDAVLFRRWRLLIAPVVGTALLLLVQMTVAYRDGAPQIFAARQWIEQLWPSDSQDIVHRISTSIVYLGGSVAWLVLLAGARTRRKSRSLAMCTAAIGAAAALWDIYDRETAANASAFAHVAFFGWNGCLPLVWVAIECTGLVRENGPWQAIRSLWRHDISERTRQLIMLLVWSIAFWYLGTLNGPFVAPRAILPCALSITLIVLALSASSSALPSRYGVSTKSEGSHPEVTKTDAGTSVVQVEDHREKRCARCSAAVTLAIGIAVAVGDYQWAGVYREYATKLAAQYRPERGTTYFFGHWGWQHYADAAGMVQFDPGRSRLMPGDIVVWPHNVDCPMPTALILLHCREIARETVPAHSWLPRTRSQAGLIFLYGDTEHGRVPWGWTAADDPLEVFVVFQR